jgi:hypothetical protein
VKLVEGTDRVPGGIPTSLAPEISAITAQASQNRYRSAGQ